MYFKIGYIGTNQIRLIPYFKLGGFNRLNRAMQPSSYSQQLNQFISLTCLSIKYNSNTVKLQTISIIKAKY